MRLVLKLKLSEETCLNVKKASEKCINQTINGKSTCLKCLKNCIFLEKYEADPQRLNKYLNKDGNIEYILPYSCHLCGLCAIHCPQNIDLGQIFYLMRKDAYQLNSKMRFKHLGIKIHQKLSFSQLMSSKSWKINQSDRVFIPGCSLASYNPEGTQALMEYLQEHINGLSMLVKCCAQPSQLIGDEKGFAQKQSLLFEELKRLGVGEVIVACQNCYRVLQEHFSHIKVTSVWNLLSEIGIPRELEGVGRKENITLAVHDSCSTRQEEKIHQSVRKLVLDLGYSIKEFEHKGIHTKCCGMGGMVAANHFEDAIENMRSRANEVDVDYILTYCGSCKVAMELGGKKSLHLIDLIFGPNHVKGEYEMRKNNGLLKNWRNRYHLKQWSDRQNRRHSDYE